MAGERQVGSGHGGAVLRSVCASGAAPGPPAWRGKEAGLKGLAESKGSLEDWHARKRKGMWGGKEDKEKAGVVWKLKCYLALDLKHQMTVLSQVLKESQNR